MKLLETSVDLLWSQLAQTAEEPDEAHLKAAVAIDVAARTQIENASLSEVFKEAQEVLSEHEEEASARQLTPQQTKQADLLSHPFRCPDKDNDFLSQRLLESEQTEASPRAENNALPARSFVNTGQKHETVGAGRVRQTLAIFEAKAEILASEAQSAQASAAANNGQQSQSEDDVLSEGKDEAIRKELIARSDRPETMSSHHDTLLDQISELQSTVFMLKSENSGLSQANAELKKENRHCKATIEILQGLINILEAINQDRESEILAERRKCYLLETELQEVENDADQFWEQEADRRSKILDIAMANFEEKSAECHKLEHAFDELTQRAEETNALSKKALLDCEVWVRHAEEQHKKDLKNIKTQECEIEALRQKSKIATGLSQSKAKQPQIQLLAQDADDNDCWEDETDVGSNTTAVEEASDTWRCP